MSTLARLNGSLSNRIHTIEVLLETMTTPVQDKNQEIDRTAQIEKINELKSEANTNLIDIEAEHGTSKPRYCPHLSLGQHRSCLRRTKTQLELNHKT